MSIRFSHLLLWLQIWFSLHRPACIHKLNSIATNLQRGSPGSPDMLQWQCLVGMPACTNNPPHQGFPLACSVLLVPSLPAHDKKYYTFVTFHEILVGSYGPGAFDHMIHDQRDKPWKSWTGEKYPPWNRHWGGFIQDDKNPRWDIQRKRTLSSWCWRVTC